MLQTEPPSETVTIMAVLALASLLVITTHASAADPTPGAAAPTAPASEAAGSPPPATGDIGDVVSSSLNGETLTLKCTGGTVRMTACDPRIIRITATPRGDAKNEYGFAEPPADRPRTPVELTDGPTITFSTEWLVCHIARKPFHVEYYHPENTNPMSYPPTSGPEVVWTADGARMRRRLRSVQDEQVYGTGLGFHRFAQRGSVRVLKTNADPPAANGSAHVVSPFVVTSVGYGYLVNNTGYTRFGIDDKGDNLLTIDVPGEVLDYYFIQGPDIRDAVARYTWLAGRLEMPPRWGLGLWYRVESNWDRAKVQEVADRLREHRIPCDVLGLEPGWQTHAYPCTFVWNTERYPDPAAFLKWMSDRHFRMNLWTHPYTHESSPLYKPLEAADGAADKRVWGGLVPDFDVPATRKLFREYLFDKQRELGVAGFKLDECDGADYTGGWFFPDDTKFPSGKTGAQVHNTYGAKFQEAMHEAFRAAGRRTLALSRGNFATGKGGASAAYSDAYDIHEYMRAQANSGLIAALWCPEVRETKTEEEFIRRSQIMLLSAVAQLDSWNSGVLPWDKGPKAEAVFRRFAELRARLMPYLYGSFWAMHTTGVPVVRPLVADYQGDGKVRDIYDEYMFGNSILVAPVLEGTKRDVYLPCGRWTHLLSNETVRGGRILSMTVPLEDVPLYVPDGAIIPIGPVRQYADEPVDAPLEVHVYAGQSGEFTMAYDDGVSVGAVPTQVAFRYQEDIGRRELRIETTNPVDSHFPPNRDYVVVVHNPPAVQAIRVDDEALPKVSGPNSDESAPRWWANDTTLHIILPPTPRRGALPPVRVVMDVEAPKPDADGFVPLFNGRDLAGWQIMGRGGDWRVENGEIVCGGRTGSGPDWLCTAHQYKDFTLHIEYQMSEDSCNSGVFLRTSLTGRQSRAGMEMQILGPKGGSPTGKNAHGSIYDVVGPLAYPGHGAKEWNVLQVTCQGRHLTATLNGVLIHDRNLDDPAINAGLREGRKMWQRLPAGYIGLQDHGHVIRFRNIRIKTLP